MFNLICGESLLNLSSKIFPFFFYVTDYDYNTLLLLLLNSLYFDYFLKNCYSFSLVTSSFLEIVNCISLLSHVTVRGNLNLCWNIQTFIYAKAKACKEKQRWVKLIMKKQFFHRWKFKLYLNIFFGNGLGIINSCS